MSDPANPQSHELIEEDHRPTCAKCGDEFIRGWDHYPRKVRHIYHSQHPLTLINQSDESEIAIPEQGKSNFVFNKCNWCGGDLQYKFYRCSICGFCLDLDCSLKSPPLTITNPKCHHHPLLFFPRPFLLPCDACGLVNISEPVYTCFPCHYVVHQSCIDLPRQIKITHHPHRLSYTPFFPPDYSTCKICYKTVDIKYGQYSCNHDGCNYVAHSKCATHEKVWDGDELEWEPDDTNETEDISPYETVGVGVIKYFCHEHHLKLQRYERVRDADKQCEACILPMDYCDFYTCMQCNFHLHEVCASLPRKLSHASHHHPLLLEPYGPYLQSHMCCSTCHREFNGFQYKCSRDDCQMTEPSFKVDIRCILVPNVSTYRCHAHPLFINTCFSREDTFYCNGCKGAKRGQISRLECTLCEFTLCYFCATLPDEIYYKHAEHPLSLCYGEDVDGTYWCETCEKKIDPARQFYTSTKRCITIHIGCIMGSSMYLKHGFTFHYGGDKILEVVRNSSNSRPICSGCYERCQDLVYYKHQERCFCCAKCSWESGPDQIFRGLETFLKEF
ncbi:hypothetical protein Bca4012_013801 [Brassica carinata]